MSFASEYGKLRKKRLEEAEETAKSPTDIAPVLVPEETSDAEESGSKEFLGGYFKVGAFGDGYQFGDLLRGGTATIADTLVGIGKGAMQSMEGVADFILHGAAEGLKKIGKNNGEGVDWLSMELESLANHNTSEYFFDGANNVLETVGIGESQSIIGEKGQGIPEAVGQVGAMIGTAQWLKAAGYGDKAVNAITTALNYFSSTGSGISEAKNAGATEGEAWAYGSLKGAVDAGTEMLFGGLGKAIPVVGVSKGISSADDWFAKKVSSKISNQFYKNLVEYGVKSSAEGLEEVLAGIGTAYVKSITYMSDEDFQKLVEDENLLDQFIAGMVTSGLAQSGYVPGMTEGSLKEANAEGRDFISGLTKNETKVADHEYKKRVEAEEADGKKLTNKEKDKIYNDVLEDVKKGYISTDTIEEVLGGDSYKSYMDSIDSDNAAIKELEGVYEGEELEAAKKDILDNSKRTELKKKLSKDVLGQTVSGKDSYLTNSYLEVEKRGQAFEADLESYTSESAKQTIQNIIDSGVANNTGRMHELANLLAKISEDKGIVFSVTDAKRLAQTSYAVDGKAVNGYITEDGITINIDSKKYLNSVVGHEITHALEGTEFYDALQQTVFEYAMAKGEYKDRLRKARELYKGVEGYKGADGFSKIKKEVAADLVGDYLFTDSDFIANLSTKNRNLFQKLFDEIKYLCKIATAGSREARQLERVKRAFEDAYRAESKATEDTKYSLESVEGADTSSNEIGLHDAKDITDMHTGYENVPDALLGFRKNGYSKEYEAQNYPYNLKLWVSVDGGYHFFKDEIKGMNYNHALERAYRNWDDGVFRLREDVGAKQKVEASGNTKYSLSDSDGKKLTKEQSEYFKDSKMRDENGNLKVMYHGSQDAGFHTFDAKFSDDDRSFFFVDRNDVAASYSGTSETYEAQTIRTAEDMNKFIESIGVEGYEVIEHGGKFSLLYEGDNIADSDTAQGIYDEFCWYEGVGEGDANYKVYLNLKNPLEVDAKGRPWNKIDAELSQEVYDKYNSLTPEEKAALTDLAEWEDFRLFNSEIQEAEGNELASAYEKMGEDVNIYDLFSVAADNFSEDSMRENARKYLKTRDYAQRAKEGGYDGVIFKNIIDNGGYSNGSEGASTVAIAFDSNQIKSVANDKPTADKDIRYSLTEQDTKKLKDVGLEYDEKSKTVSYSLSSLEDAFNYQTNENGLRVAGDDYQKARDEYVNALAKSIALDKGNPTAEEKAKASKYLDGLFLIHDMIAADKDRLDYVAAVGKSSWVSNSEYGGSIDFSTLCAKRRLFTGTFDAIQNALPDTVLNENDFLTIRDMLLEKGLESPCSMCYVEGSRAKHGEYVAKWLKEYLATDPAWKPQIADFTSSTRLERTRIEHPEAYAEYQKAMNKLAQRKPKEASVRTDYRGEILVEFEDGSSVEVKNNNGGIRFNSFSDFEIIHALDCMQVITDMARVGLNGQAYTKVKEFAESFGGTGLKINLSLVAKDVDQNGKLVMDEVNGMKYDEAMEIRNKYSDNVGTVIVVFNDEQLKAALADSTIDYVLPFHRSQWKKSQYNLMGLPGVTKDYTALQNDRTTNPNTGKPVKLAKLKQTTTYTNDITGETYTIKDNIMPNMYWDYSRNGRENANRYLDYINANQMTPKFDFLLEKSDGKWVLPEGAVGDGYFKLLIDFKMYNNEGWGAPQNPVLPEFNMPYIQQMLDNYVGGHQAFPVAQDVVDEFVKKKKSGTVQSTKALPKSQPIRSNLSLPGISPATMSLSEEGTAPVNSNKYGITSEDVKLQIGPVREDVVTAETPTPIAPVAEDVAPMIEKALKEAYDSGNAPTFETASKEQIKGQQTMFKEPATEKTIKTVKDRLEHKLRASYDELSHNEKLRREAIKGFNDKIDSLQYEYDSKKNHNTKAANDILRRIERLKRLRDDVEADYTKRINDNRAAVERRKAAFEEGYSTEEGRAMRTDLHTQKVEEIKNAFAENGLDFDDVLKNAKDLSTLSTVDNTPQRVMEKSLGYKEGQVLADLTVNKVAQNETEGIKWLNTVTSRSGEGGLLKQLSKKYHIKPGSKESAAAQMFAEGFYVNDKGETITYGSEELAKDFPNKEVQKNIKGLATDSRIRRFYDDTLTMINESRARNAYPEIKPLDNYFLHFRAIDDTFSRLGIPFNPNDIKAKDLPTDLNGVTADLKPGQPYFSSAMHRRGNKTTYDLLGGMERYASGAKNQIYHIDDIQTLRALRNYIADTYGQANGLENLDNLSEEEVQDRIKQVYNSHLSTFAKFLNEEANVIAGKTALIDRGLEGIIGRRGITFLDTVNKQVGSNMVGFNVSSSLTNLLATTQAFAKTNKTAFVKGFAQTMANKVGHLFGKADSFADNPTAIRRKGADRFYRTPWQKTADAGYAFMGAVDNVATEIIVRSKYNEFIQKGMSEQQAITEADKWASRLMGDRSLGQMPQLYNSKMLGLFTKFQLEVRNQLDSQFYDTIQETKASNKDIENGLKRNAKTAAKVAATFAELAIAQHIFGKVFESIAGYNPAFDIIDVLIKTFGFDDEEDSEDTALDNVEQGFLALLEDLPYTSTLTGGRVPIASALPVEEFVTGKDEYGNEKSRLDTLKEIAPYIVSPTGYGQVKKTIQGLSMFDDDLPVAGSYTDSGNLRFPVEDTIENRIQAGLFGKWANENAGYYFDNNISPLKEKQIKEYIEVDMPIEDYWKYRKGLSKYETLAEKADYINSLDLTREQKNILINNLANRKEAIDMTDYDEYESFAEFDFAKKYPEKYTVAKALGGYESYKKYSSELYDIKADKDANGKTVSDSRKKKVVQYINSLDIDYGAKLILYKSEYKSDDRYNYEIVDYLNSREDISYDEMATILKELGFAVDSNGNISWD